MRVRYKLLVVDDEVNIREGLAEVLAEEYDVSVAGNGREAIQSLSEETFDLVLTDIKMGPVSGDSLLRHVVTNYPTIPIIVLTGHGTIKNAVSALHKGAFDYLSKPVDIQSLQLVIKKALQRRAVFLQNRSIDMDLAKEGAEDQIFTKNRKMGKLMEQIMLIAPTNSVVLITGESGVGKEILCQRIHKLSPRHNKPLIAVHCAALSESLLESELFGHEKGAFTGSVAQRKGRFELAHGGTIFLDEIGEIDKRIQVKLLRVLQGMSFERVGGEESINVDVRIIAATNRNIREEVEKGNFREDLYYRLSVVHIEVPPLCEREEDILLYAQYFLRMFSTEHERGKREFSKRAMSIFTNYSWPGNIRELRNCVERAVILSRSTIIDVEDLPDYLTKKRKDKEFVLPLGMSLEEMEKNYIQSILDYYGGNKSKCAEVLGISRKTLYNKLIKYQLTNY